MSLKQREPQGLTPRVSRWQSGDGRREARRAPGSNSTDERGSPLGPPLPFKSTWTPEPKNGTTAGKPSKIEYGAGSGELVNELVGPGKTFGSLATLGYTEQEVITTGA